MPDFVDNFSVYTPDTVEAIFPTNILVDINFMYSLTSDSFFIRGLDTIQNEIFNVVYTPIGSRYNEPTFGSDLLVMIEEPNTASNATFLKMELFSAIKRWVPYASIMYRGTEVGRDPDTYTFWVFVNYVDILSGKTSNFKFPLYPLSLLGAQLVG